MSDIIKLLPDSVANQIAAGEVVQRPASVVKELLENAVDAEATDIKLIVKDAGRTLIQVTDNGKGMSETDARMCFERHATSKINSAHDLFALTTMGFRGEALASIGSVARVELKTRTRQAALATELIMEGSHLELQQACQAPHGTTIAVKNLFFNTPARRNFLKSDTIEKTHIVNEFLRVALAYPGIAFSYYHNNQLCLQSGAGNLSNRILNLFGSHYKQRLIPVQEETDIVRIQGYILKPEFAKRTKSDQYIFVNSRYIRSPYLSSAIEMGFDELIALKTYPAFFLFLEIDPSQIDVNVHPTKTEIKFQDEKVIYQIIKTTIRRSLGKFNIAPSLDFERETAFDDVLFDKSKPIVPPTIDVNPDYNPFQGEVMQHGGRNLLSRVNKSHWENDFSDNRLPVAAPAPEIKQESIQHTILSSDLETKHPQPLTKKFIQLNNRYILTTIKSGLMIIDQQRAHERILFERHKTMLENRKSLSQTLLFPEKIVLTETDVSLMQEIKNEIHSLGFDISEFGQNSFMINAIPVGITETENLQQLIESLLDNYRKNNTDLNPQSHINLARSLAKSLSIKSGKTLSVEEMNALTDELFSCQMPSQSPSGKPVIRMLGLDELGEMFK
jgi:DNA mismatch repair protein MutL